MNTLYPATPISQLTPPCSQILNMAERELTAFVQAVTRMFGTEQARLSANDWLCELSATQTAPASLVEWRQFTAKVSARLAKRVSATPLKTKLTAA